MLYITAVGRRDKPTVTRKPSGGAWLTTNQRRRPNLYNERWINYEIT